MISFSYCVWVLNSILGPMWGPTGVLTYATTEKEAFAIVWAIQNLQTYIYDRDFVVETENSENQRLLRCFMASYNNVLVHHQYLYYTL